MTMKVEGKDRISLGHSHNYSSLLQGFFIV